MPSSGGEQFARFDRVEQVVDGVLGVGGHEHRGVLPAVRDLGLDQRVAQRVPVGDRPLVEIERRERFVVGQHDRERAEFFVEPLEQGVDRRPRSLRG